MLLFDSIHISQERQSSYLNIALILLQEMSLSEGTPALGTSITQTSQFPLRLDWKAIWLPSGDHLGHDT
jgi:hypothetical protein